MKEHLRRRHRTLRSNGRPRNQYPRQKGEERKAYSSRRMPTSWMSIHPATRRSSSSDAGIPSLREREVWIWPSEASG